MLRLPYLYGFVFSGTYVDWCWLKIPELSHQAKAVGPPTHFFFFQNSAIRGGVF